MVLFGKEIEEGIQTYENEFMKIIYEVKRIEHGYLVEGSISGNKTSKTSRIEIARFKASEQFIFNNWQSWGPTMKVPKQFMSRAMWKTMRTQLSGKMEYNLSPILDDWYESPVSDYFIASEEFLFGFLTSQRAHSFFVLEDEELVVYLEYFEIFDEDCILEPFVILENEKLENLFEVYMCEVILKHDINFKKELPVGWCSWYQYFTNFTWEDMNKNLENSKNYSYNLFQIDDSYQNDIGDWFVPGNDFPGTALIADKIKSYGYTAGLWTAPFSISETSEIFINNPQWLVKDEQGKPKKCYRNWNKNIYALDVTNPDAAEWLKYTFKRLKSEGYDYFKIDFLFAGAMPGKRNIQISPISAYIEGMNIIRNAVGKDSFVLGCGAPLLPSIGLVDGMRIGPDTSTDWGSDRSVFDGSPNAHFALQNTLFRQFMHRKLWLNDPDCIMLRSEDIKQTEEERKLFSTVSGLLDNMILQSDDLSKVDERGMRIFNETISLLGGNSRVFNILSNDEIYEIKREKDGIVDTYLINIGDKEGYYGEIKVNPKQILKI